MRALLALATVLLLRRHPRRRGATGVHQEARRGQDGTRSDRLHRGPPTDVAIPSRTRTASDRPSSPACSEEPAGAAPPGQTRQTVIWDGKDDFGKPAAAGRSRVRVQTRLEAEFGSFVMHNPHGSGTVSAVAVDRRLALRLSQGMAPPTRTWAGTSQVYTREGKHQKVILPFPRTSTRMRVKDTRHLPGWKRPGSQHSQLETSPSTRERGDRGRTCRVHLPGSRFEGAR